MAPLVSAAVQVILYLVEHKEEIKQMVVALEELAGQVAGPEKAAAIRSSIGAALGIEDKIEQAWPTVAPLFNLFVKSVKAEPAKLA